MNKKNEGGYITVIDFKRVATDLLTEWKKPKIPPRANFRIWEDLECRIERALRCVYHQAFIDAGKEYSYEKMQDVWERTPRTNLPRNVYQLPRADRKGESERPEGNGDDCA